MMVGQGQVKKVADIAGRKLLVLICLPMRTASPRLLAFITTTIQQFHGGSCCWSQRA
jgi:hypothetical protein